MISQTVINCSLYPFSVFVVAYEIDPIESKIRESFLKLFINILMNYKRYLIYPTDMESTVEDRFHFDAFLAGKLKSNAI